MKELILRCALQNAIKYNGKADINSVLGLFFALNKTIKNKNEIVDLVKKTVSEVNNLTF